MRLSPVLLSSLLLGLPSFAWELRTDSEGDVVQWKNRYSMVLDQRFAELLGDANANQAVGAAVKVFAAATPYLEVSMTEGEAKPIGYVVGAKDNTNSILALEDWPYSDDALAVTLVTMNARTNEILDADIAFNIESHRFKVLPDNAKTEHRFDDVQNTFSHELGHALGLMHNNMVDDLVMYPSAAPGETLKRTLKTDDRDGLLSLYGTAPVEVPVETAAPLGGCSATGAPPSWLWCIPMLLLMAVPRRKLVRVAVFALPGLAMAAESVPPSVERAHDVAVVTVLETQARPHPQYPGLIVSELRLQLRECLKGACSDVKALVVPGGRVGDIEQVVIHEPVPVVGAQVLVIRTQGRLRMVHLEADAQARVVDALRLAGSMGTQTSTTPLVPTVQVPAITP